ncbi:MAG TPA: response regulator [Thermoanaerobaculia bacterium]|nr:response regulator [Thermoanaerobaculia bacterium]
MLVVENDEVVVALISHILARHSYAVHSTSGIVEAERLIESEPWDAILLDLKMPDGSGVDLIRRLEARSPDLLRRIIVVTGAIPEARKLVDVPLWAVIRKPFEVAALIDTVTSCTSGKARQ